MGVKTWGKIKDLLAMGCTVEIRRSLDTGIISLVAKMGVESLRLALPGYASDESMAKHIDEMLWKLRKNGVEMK